MRNVCKEVHVHLVDPSFLLFLLLSLDLLHLLRGNFTSRLEYQIDSSSCNKQIHYECPPREPEWSTY